MKLIKYKVALMVESTENLFRNPNYEFVEDVDPNTQDDITTLENLNAFGHMAGRDYMIVLTVAKTLFVATGGFVAQSDNDKRASVRMALCNSEEAQSIGYTLDQFISFQDNLCDETLKVRMVRVDMARKDFGRELLDGTMTYEQVNALLSDTRDILTDYIVGNSASLLNWINTEFNEAKSYFSQERKDKFLNKIMLGI